MNYGKTAASEKAPFKNSPFDQKPKPKAQPPCFKNAEGDWKARTRKRFITSCSPDNNNQ